MNKNWTAMWTSLLRIWKIRINPSITQESASIAPTWMKSRIVKVLIIRRQFFKGQASPVSLSQTKKPACRSHRSNLKSLEKSRKDARIQRRKTVCLTPPSPSKAQPKDWSKKTSTRSFYLLKMKKFRRIVEKHWSRSRPTARTMTILLLCHPRCSQLLTTEL